MRHWRGKRIIRTNWGPAAWPLNHTKLPLPELATRCFASSIGIYIRSGNTRRWSSGPTRQTIAAKCAAEGIRGYSPFSGRRSNAGDLAEFPKQSRRICIRQGGSLPHLPSGTIYGSSAMRFTAAQYSTASSSQQHLQARMDAWAGLGISLENLAQCMFFGSPTCIQDAAAVALDEAVTKRCGFLKRTAALHR